MRDNVGKPFIATFYNVLLVPDFCGRLFSIVTLMNLRHTCLFNTGFFTIFFSDNKHNAVKLLHSTQRKHTFLVETKEKSKSQKKAPKRKIFLEVLHHRSGQRSTRSLLARDTENFWQYIELRVYPDTLCTSYQISTTNRKFRSKTSMKSKTPFKWVLMEIIPATSSKSLTKIILLIITL